MNEQTAVAFGMIIEKMETLALSLGTTAEYLWGVLVAQALVTGVTNIIAFICLTIIGFLLFNVWKKVRIRNNKIQKRESGYEAFNRDSSSASFVIFTVILVGYLMFSGSVFLVSLNDTVTAFVNPEYIAFKEVAQLMQ